MSKEETASTEEITYINSLDRQQYTDGYTTNEGLLLDLDNTNYEDTHNLAAKATEFYNLEGFLIAESSPKNHHIIFNQRMNWTEALSTLFKIVWRFRRYYKQAKPKLTDWAILQAIKGSMTLRISSKLLNLRPNIIDKKGQTDDIIRDYLTFYNQENRNGGEQQKCS